MHKLQASIYSTIHLTTSLRQHDILQSPAKYPLRAHPAGTSAYHTAYSLSSGFRGIKAHTLKFAKSKNFLDNGGMGFIDMIARIRASHREGGGFGVSKTKEACESLKSPLKPLLHKTNTRQLVLTCPLSFSRLRRQFPPGGSLYFVQTTCR